MSPRSIASTMNANKLNIFGVFAIVSFLCSILMLTVYIQDQAEQNQQVVNSNYQGCVGGNEFRHDVINIGNGTDTLLTFIVATLSGGSTNPRTIEFIKALDPGFVTYRGLVSEIKLSDCDKRYPTADQAQH